MKNGDLTIVYGAVTLLSVTLAIFLFVWGKKRTKSFLALFSCVATVNCGYFLLSVSNSLPVAKAANAISYFGAAFSVLVMLIIIADVCQIRRCRFVNSILFTVTTVMFIIAASADWCGLFYRSVSLININGMSKLVKEYGPLHGLYALYLWVYLLLMFAAILYAVKKKRLVSPKYALFLLIAVCLNIGVWAVEQFVDVDFEFLSVSYIATELLLLLIDGLLSDYGIIHPQTGMVSIQMLAQLSARSNDSQDLPPGMTVLFSSFARKVQTLTSAEHRILNYYINGYEIAEIPNLAYISINTVKKHNHSIYQKLEIASRDELMLYIELFRRCNRLHELTQNSSDPQEMESLQ